MALQIYHMAVLIDVFGREYQEDYSKKYPE